VGEQQEGMSAGGGAISVTVWEGDRAATQRALILPPARALKIVARPTRPPARPRAAHSPSSRRGRLDAAQDPRLRDSLSTSA
jgi:hypothetical protein